MTPNTDYDIGQFYSTGYQPVTLATATITDTDPNSDSFTRYGGALGAVVLATFTVSGSSSGDTAQILIQGSMDDSNWHTVAESPAYDATALDGTTKAINATIDPVVDLGRFTYLRVRLVEVGGSTISVDVVVNSVRRAPGQAVPYTDTLTRSAATMTGTTRYRSAGSRFVVAQLVVTNLALGAGSGVRCNLQASPDDGTTWFTIGTVLIAANGSFLLEQNGSTLLDLGHFTTFRVQTADVGGTVTSYTADVYVGLDTADWLIAPDGSGIGATTLTDETLITSTLVSVGTESANKRRVTFQLYQANGSPLLEPRIVQVVLSDTSGAGALDLATTAVVDAVTTGTAKSATGANQIIVQASSGGVVAFDILDANVETVYACLVSPQAPQSTPCVIVQSEQATVAFA